MIFFFARQYIRHLEKEIEWYRGQLDRERTRAENSIDELLNLKLEGRVAPITRPTNLPSPPPADEVARRLLADQDFDQIGMT